MIYENYTSRLWNTLKDSLCEGGWRMPSLTSTTELTPDVVDASMKALESLEKKFAIFLKKNPRISVAKRGKGVREIVTSKPLDWKTATVSTHYYKDDKKTNPNARYGDINQVEQSFIKSKTAFNQMKDSELIDYISIVKN